MIEMLNMLIGRSGTGKTTALYRELKERAAKAREREKERLAKAKEAAKERERAAIEKAREQRERTIALEKERIAKSRKKDSDVFVVLVNDHKDDADE